MVKFDSRGNLVRIVCPRCTEKSNEPNICESELTVGTDITEILETNCNGVDDTDSKPKVQCLQLPVQELQTHVESVHVFPSVSCSQPEYVSRPISLSWVKELV